MGLFSSKPGGTFFGNLLRTVVPVATGGLVKLPPPPPAVTVTTADGTTAPLSAPIYDQPTSSGVLTGILGPTGALSSIGNFLTGTTNAANSVNTTSKILQWVLIGVGIFFLWKLFKKKKRG